MMQQAADWIYAMEREQTENLPFHTLTLYIYQFFFYKHLKYKKCFFSSLLCSWHFALQPFDEHIMNNWVALKLKQKETGTDKTALTSFFSYVFIVLSNLSK